MTIQQLEYIIAVDNYRHFAKAAEACYVTQPTLSMMIQKLEEELDVKIFDRSAHPVEPTRIGEQILHEARVSVRYFSQIRELVDNEKNMLTGDFRLGVIPTIASYVVPELLQQMKESSLNINLMLQEMPTSKVVEYVLNGKLDGGLLATPLKHPMLIEYPIYYEKFYAYISPLDSDLKKQEEIDLQEVDVRTMWLLENVHCLRGQIVKLCQLRKEKSKHETIKYESGSIETLINIVDYNGGMTIIPEMAAMSLSEDRQENLRRLKGDVSVREVSLIVNRDFVRQRMADSLIEIIKDCIPISMQDPALKQYAIDVSYD